MEETNNESIEKKLAYLNETKGLIKSAIINKGQELTDETPFRDYVQKIDDIETGVDTSDATATTDDIISSKTAYVNGEKITGNIEEGYSVSDLYAQAVTFTCPDANWDSGRFCMVKIDENTFVYIKVATEGYLTFYKLNTNSKTITTLKKFDITSLGFQRDNNRITSMDISNEFNENHDRHMVIVFWDGKTSTGSSDNINIFDINMYDLNNIQIIRNAYYTSKAGTEINTVEFFDNNPNKFICSNGSRIYTINGTSVSYITYGALGGFRYLGSAQIQSNDQIVMNHNTDTNDKSLKGFRVNNLQQPIAQFNTTLEQTAGAMTTCFTSALQYCLVGTHLYYVEWSSTYVPTFTKMFNTNVIPDFGTTYPAFIDIDKDDTLLWAVSQNKGIVYKFKADGNAFEKVIEASMTYNFTGGWGAPANGSYPIIKPNDRYMVATNGTAITLIKVEYGAKNVTKLTYKNNSYYRLMNANATPMQVLEGSTFMNNSGEAVGTMPNNGTLSFPMSEQSQSIPKGYTNGGTIAPAVFTEMSEYNTCLNIVDEILE